MPAWITKRSCARPSKEVDIVLWDGGNNDFSFYVPDLAIVVADPHRAGHERTYHPGETNVRSADVFVINKVDTAQPENVIKVRKTLQALNPDAIVIEAASPLFVDQPELIRGKRVLVIEDGPTLTHGEMAYGAGWVAARRYGAAEIVDPRPFAVGAIIGTYRKYPNTGPILPAMGYGDEMIHDLEDTINQLRRRPGDFGHADRPDPHHQGQQTHAARALRAAGNWQADFGRYSQSKIWQVIWISRQ